MFSQMNQFLGGIEWGTSIWFKFGIWNKWWLLQIFVWILLISSDWGPLCPMIFPILLVVNKKLVKIARFNLQVSQNHLLPLPRPQFQPIKFAMCPLILQKCLAQQASFFLPTQTFSNFLPFFPQLLICQHISTSPVGSPWFRPRLLDVVFGAVHEDPPVVLLAALGDDFTELEEQLPWPKKPWAVGKRWVVWWFYNV